MSTSEFSVLAQGDTEEDVRLPRLACSLQGLPWPERRQQRQRTIAALGLESLDSIPAWDEATQLAAQYLAAPMAMISLVSGATEVFRAACGLSHLGVGNPLSQQRQIPLEQGLGSYVVDSERPLVVVDTLAHPALARSELVVVYGVRAYCAVPLITAAGLCLGTLAVMDTQPRSFGDRDLGFLAMAARWGMGEYERQRAETALTPPRSPSPATATDSARLSLLKQLTQDLRSPLTTVLGMTTMLSREIYGPLTPKQREYTDIVHRSSQALMSLVEEIIGLAAAEAGSRSLVPTPIDIATLGQQVIATLTPLAEEKAQTLTLTVEPGESHWILDQRTVKDIFYHLVFSIMQVAEENNHLCIHACRRGQALALVLWLANPWLGEGLPPEVLDICAAQTADASARAEEIPPSLLGLRLSQQLAQHHGGYLTLQGSPDSSCRLMVVLPVLETTVNRTEPGAAPMETAAPLHL